MERVQHRRGLLVNGKTAKKCTSIVAIIQAELLVTLTMGECSREGKISIIMSY